VNSFEVIIGKWNDVKFPEKNWVFLLTQKPKIACLQISQSRKLYTCNFSFIIKQLFARGYTQKTQLLKMLHIFVSDVTLQIKKKNTKKNF
jgi:hypothetical protein